MGPFGGLDTTTSRIALGGNASGKTRAKSGFGFVLNRRYGALVTVKGRRRILTLPVNAVYGMTEFSTTAGSPQYIAAADFGPVTLLGGIFQFKLDGTNARLTLPNSETLTPGQNTDFANYAQWCFLTNAVDTPLKIDSSLGVTFWGIVAPTNVLSPATSGGGLINAKNGFAYAQTFANTVQESSPSDPTGSTKAVATNNQITVSNLQVSTDPQVTTSNIYRLGGDSGQAGTWIYVGSVANSTTTFVDNTPDGNLTGSTLVQHRDPPTKFKQITTHKNAMWGFGYAGDAVGEPAGTPATNDVWFSNPFEPWGFDNTNQVIPLDRNVAEDDLLNGASLGGIVFCVKRKSVWVITGNSVEDYFGEKMYDIPCSGANSLVVGLGQAFWASDNTVYTFAAGQYQDIGQPLKSFFDTLTNADKAAASGAFNDQCYILAYPTLGLSISYDLRTGEWTQYPWSATYFAWGTQAAATSLPATIIIGSEVASGAIDQWFASDTDLNAPITMQFLTGVSPCGDAGVIKEFTHGVLIVRPVDTTKMAEITITVTTDPFSSTQTPVPQAINLAANPYYVYIFELPQRAQGYLVQVQIDVSCTTPVEIDGFSLRGNPSMDLVPNV